MKRAGKLFFIGLFVLGHHVAAQAPAVTQAPAPTDSTAPKGSAKQLISALEDKLYADDKQKAVAGDFNRNTNLLNQISQFVAQIDTGEGNIQTTWQQLSRELDPRYFADARAIQQQLDLEETAREKEAFKQMDDMVAQMKEPILAAKTDGDLDDQWLKLVRIQRDFTQRGFGNSYGNGADATPLAKLNAAIGFVTTWQSYLAAKNAGYNDAALAALQRLRSGNGSGDPVYPILPRSDLDKRIAGLTAALTSSATPDDPHGLVDALIDGMHNGDDAPSVWLQVNAIARQQQQQDAFTAQLTSLEFELKSLISCTVDAREGRYGNILAIVTVPPKDQSPWYPKLSKFFTQAFTDVLPSFVGWDEMPPRQENEKPDDYIRRCALAARDQEKWWVELNLLEVLRNYALRNGTPTWLLGDLYSLQNMMNAENLEAAGQFEPAIVYYDGAVRFGSKYGPVKAATAKLKALQQSQPDAYASAMKDAQAYCNRSIGSLSRPSSWPTRNSTIIRQSMRATKLLAPTCTACSAWPVPRKNGTMPASSSLSSIIYGDNYHTQMTYFQQQDLIACQFYFKAIGQVSEKRYAEAMENAYLSLLNSRKYGPGPQAVALFRRLQHDHPDDDAILTPVLRYQLISVMKTEGTDLRDAWVYLIPNDL